MDPRPTTAVTALCILLQGCVTEPPPTTLDPTPAQREEASTHQGEVHPPPTRNATQEAPEQPDLREAETTVTAVTQGPKPTVVVAVVDTGINPYHAAFRTTGMAPDPAWNATPIQLTFGVPYEEAVERDRSTWDGLQHGKPYHFPGTRIVGAISFDGDAQDPVRPSGRHPILDDDGHGTGVAGVVAATGPEVGIVIVEARPATSDEGILWAAGQPWIDVITVSIGNLLALPSSHAGADSHSNASWAATQAGKLYVNGVGNEPVPPSFTDPYAGPPWVVSVGMASEATRGDQVKSRRFADFVAAGSVRVPRYDSVDQDQSFVGTSFATPAVATTIAVALGLLRNETWAADHGVAHWAPAPLTPELAARLRSAANETAVYFGPSDYRPIDDPPNWFAYNPSVPVLDAPGTPVGPWLQMGWGWLNDTSAEPLARQAAQDPAPWLKPADAREHMARLTALREAVWELDGLR